jgi:hypothetical protein
MSEFPGNLTLACRHYDDGAPSQGDEGAYLIPPELHHPADIAQRLLQLEEFDHLTRGDARIDWLLKRDTKVKGGRQILGATHLPKVQGDLNPCFVWMLERLFGRPPDFLIILDKSFWYQATPRLREILVFHELSHCIHKTNRFGEPMYDQDERPVWAIRSHDVEEFISVVHRYGAWNQDIQEFVKICNQHDKTT